MTNKSEKLKVGIVGASGYGGSELLRLLLGHPHAEISLATANEHAGKKAADVHRNLLSLSDIVFTSTPEDLSSSGDLDVVFFALPHGQAMRLIPSLPSNVRAIDLSGDFRLNDHETFERYYGFRQSEPELQNDAVYGLTETNREAIKVARVIANPGCFATATILGLAPLVAANLIGGAINVDAKTGSSGSGIKPATNTHHPQRVNSFYAYKPFRHQHVPEIRQHLESLGDFSKGFVFMTHSLPVSRGIFVTSFVPLAKSMESDELKDLFVSFYGKASGRNFFVRLVDDSPDINWVKMTNFCDLAVHSDGETAVVFSAIDNLVKGAAGQAIQNMNVMFGFEETTGLRIIGSNP
jgi:N-acetyl-gamma-glutamyl-phosphate reductase common form